MSETEDTINIKDFLKLRVKLNVLQILIIFVFGIILGVIIK